MQLTLNKDKLMTLALCMLVVYGTILIPPDAMAATGGQIGKVLCSVAGWFTGPVGAGIATLAILVIGVGALMGKVSWGMAIIVGIGIAVIFGADPLVNELSGHKCSEYF